ncbi:MAG: site-specific DNA recombinase [Candidatus Azotimanducaceae bacterium]|jgi:site-specific DNA recombinase
MSKPAAAAVYARISSDQEGTGLGVQRQLEDCRKLAASEGWTISEEYVDNDVSAFKGKRRPRYEDMLADLRDGVRDGVLVYHQDRLTRRPIELEQFVEVIEAAGVRDVRFVAGGPVDALNGDGLTMARVMSAIAADESRAKSRRVKRKLDEVAASGRPHGGSRRPFGFESDRITHRRDEAEVIRVLVACFLAGESLRSLAMWMDDQGITTVFGKAWRTTTIRDMLISPRIAGLRQHRGEVIGDAVWELIITPADRTRMLAMLEQKRNTGRRTPRRYLLSGLLRCGRCSHTLFSSRRESSRRYVCMGGPNHRGCGRLTVVAEPVEQLAGAAVLYRLDTPELADVIAGRAAQDERAAALSDNMGDDSRQLDELAQAYAAKQITMREWLTAREPIEGRIRDAQRRLDRITRTDSLAGFIGNGEALHAQWSELNLTRQHAIIRAVLDHAVVAPTDVRGGSFNPDRVGLVWRV